MNDFDRGARHAVKACPSATIRWLFLRTPESLGFQRWLDSQSAPRPGEPDRRCDTIAELIDREGLIPPWVCVIELFTEPDSNAIDRALEYQFRFRRELRHGPGDRDKYQFAAAMIFLTGQPRETKVSMNLPGMEEIGTWSQPRILDMPAEDAVAHLEAIEQNRLARGLLAWVPLMRHGQSEEIVARWRAQVELEQNDELARTVVDAAMTFSWLTDSRDVWMKGLEGLMLKHSPYLDEVRIEMLQKLTLRALETRFPGQVPASLVEQIKAETDLTVLDNWNTLALTASLEQFQEEMG